MQAHHIVLLGDSILDNKVYTRSKRCVTEHLRAKLSGWRFTLCAVDGHVINDVVHEQLKHVPEDATALVLSVGGNDGLRMLGELQNDGVSLWGFCRKISEIRGRLRERYEAMLQKVLARALPVVLLSPYKPSWHLHSSTARLHCGLSQQMIALFGLHFLRKVILRLARKHRLPVIDLAEVFDSAQDYANPIEPSVWGGDKISGNIIHAISTHDFTKPHHAVYCRKGYSSTTFPRGEPTCVRAASDEAPGHVAAASLLSRGNYNERFRQ